MGNPVTISECCSANRGIIYDTNVLIDVWKDKLRQGPIFANFLKIPMQQRYCSIVAAFEFLNGVKKNEFIERRQWLKNIGIKLLHISEKASKTFWTLFNSFRFEKGLLCDMLIAATTLSLGYVIASNNIKDFKTIRGLDWVQEFNQKTLLR